MKEQPRKTENCTLLGQGFIGGALLAVLVTISSVHAGRLVEEQKLVASDAAAADSFGASIAVSGNTAVVGASWDDDVGSQTGAAYVFKRRETAWNEWGVLRAKDKKAGSFFGHSVSIDDTDGYTIAVGAFGGDEKGQAAGAAYILRAE